jgi:hypothetical protein
MWAMVLAVAAFLVYIVAPIDAVFGGGSSSGAAGPSSRLAISAVQAAAAIASVILLAFAMSRLKRAYLKSKL